MTFVSTLGQSLDQVERLKMMQLQLSTLQSQLATGKKTQLFKGLGNSVVASERARADLRKLDGYSNNITIADRRLKMMVSAVDQIRQQAGDIANAIQLQTQEGEIELESVTDLASKVKEFMMTLMNERDGDRFLFGGAETLSQPLNDTGTMDTYLQAQISDWLSAGIDTDELIDSYRDRGQLTDTLMGYSVPLSAGSAKNVFVRVDDNVEVDYTVFANNKGFRDIIVVAGMLENMGKLMDEVSLDPDDPVGTVTAPGATRDEQNENFFAMFNDLARMLNGALDGLETVEANLSQAQARIHDIGENHKVEKNVLLNTIGDIEDADMNEVAVKLNALQIQLEASYRVTASVAGLSLVNFLS
jgi:flagellar hook-associated protein 3 FlgL